MSYLIYVSLQYYTYIRIITILEYLCSSGDFVIHIYIYTNLNDKKNNAVLRAELSHIANVFYSSYKPTKSALKKHGILKKLKNNPNIYNGVVSLDENVYKECMYKILNDNTKFKVLDKDPTLYREGQLQRKLLNCKKIGFLRIMYTPKSTLMVLSLLEFTVYQRCIKSTPIFLVSDPLHHLWAPLIMHTWVAF